jgi:hypothetical protein
VHVLGGDLVLAAYELAVCAVTRLVVGVELALGKRADEVALAVVALCAVLVGDHAGEVTVEDLGRGGKRNAPLT